MTAREIIENIDSMEGGFDPNPPDEHEQEIQRFLHGHRSGRRYQPREHSIQFRSQAPKFAEQWPSQPNWHLGHRSSRMSMNRNNRRKSFGYSDTYSLRDRGWPLVNRGHDRRRKAWERAVAKFGQVRGAGEGI